MIISFLNQKGGVGKTTLCVNLASYWARQGARIAVIDADPQGSSQAWSAARSDAPLFPVIGMARPTLHKELTHLAGEYHTVLIDGPPRSNDIARAAIMASDLVVIPVQPSPLDVWASDDTVRLIEEAQVFRPALAAAFLINRKIAGTVIGRDVHEAFAEHALPVLDMAVCQRVVFAEAAASGLSVFETDPKSRAAMEIAHLADALDAYRGRIAA